MIQETWDANGNLIERLVTTDDEVVVEFRTDDPGLLAMLPSAADESTA